MTVLSRAKRFFFHVVLSRIRQVEQRIGRLKAIETGAFRDAAVLASLSVLVFAISAWFDVFNKVISWIYRHDTWQLDEMFTVAVFLVVAFGVYAYRRHKELVVQIGLRKKAERDKARVIAAFAREQDYSLKPRSLLPICSACRRVRSISGYWVAVEKFVEEELDARLTYGHCPECAKKLTKEGLKDVHSRGSGVRK
jgi:hypothetical protein